MYRLYIDETGNADLGASHDPNHRFLSLTGIIMSQDHARHVAYPRLENLKAEFFDSHPDEPVILHRKDVMTKKRPFHTLREEGREEAFNEGLLTLLRDVDYKVITAVIDKLDHVNRYAVWRHDPYHYCLEVLIERYCMFLKPLGARGDVMAEVRNGKFDRMLERCYAKYLTAGTSQMRAVDVAERLTSKKLKLKPKSANVAGLQIADAIAYPSAQYVRSIYNNEPAPDRFSGQIADILVQQKYRRGWGDRVRGFGMKWLP